MGERLCRPREEWNEGTVLSESLTLYLLLLAEDSSPSRMCGDYGRLLNGKRRISVGSLIAANDGSELQVIGHGTEIAEKKHFGPRHSVFGI